MTMLQLYQAKLIRDENTNKEAMHHNTWIQWYKNARHTTKVYSNIKVTDTFFGWITDMSLHFTVSMKWNLCLTKKKMFICQILTVMNSNRT